MHGIGFDTDDGISSNRTFKVYGSQSWGIPLTTYTGAGAFQTYSNIAVGSYFTGSFSRLIFAMDHDVANPNGESVFSNIVVTGCN